MTNLTQQAMNLPGTQGVDSVEEYQFEPIKGYPMLQWQGKRPFRSTQYYPAQLKEMHGPAVEGWRNKVYWGDNLQVMSHLLKEYRGTVRIAYIDPPFDSRAEYRIQVKVRGSSASNDSNAFEEKQYSDIWTNDEYLQFVYERLIVIRELLAEDGSVYFHCDWNRGHYLKVLTDEVFGYDRFRNHIVWKRSTPRGNSYRRYPEITDFILLYTRNSNNIWHNQYVPYSQEYLDKYYNYIDEATGRKYQPTSLLGHEGVNPVREWRGISRPWRYPIHRLDELDAKGLIYWPTNDGGIPRFKRFLDEQKGIPLQSLWDDIPPVNSQATEDTGYPTQKPEALLERIIRASSNPGDLVFDCFMGSGTTQAAAMKLGRRFIGADINLGAVQITSKRLIQVGRALEAQPPVQKGLGEVEQGSEGAGEQGSEGEEGAGEQEPTVWYTGVEVYNVNNYDIFRNPVEAKALLLEALEVQPLPPGHVYDGEKDGRLVKVMPVNRIATRADLNELIAGFDLRSFGKRREENPNRAVEKITLVCMGHEPDLAAQLQREAHPYKLDVEVVDILRDKQELQFKRDAEARVAVRAGWLVIEAFYPMNLLGKLSMQKETVGEWRELVESVMVDWNYDGAVLTPAVVDVPEKDGLVAGRYQVPEDAGTVRVKITDLLSESWEGEVGYGG